MPSTGDKLCGCHVVTGAGVIASLQFVMLAICMASSGIILDRYWDWQQYQSNGWVASGEINYADVANALAKNETLRTGPNRWAVAWLELGMAWYIGFCAFWLFSLLILAFSFKYYRPVFVVPNFTVLVIGIFMNLFAFAVTLAYTLNPSKYYELKTYDQALIVYTVGVFLFGFIMNIIFIINISKYHKYLRVRYGHQVPKFVSSRPPRTGYSDGLY